MSRHDPALKRARLRIGRGDLGGRYVSFHDHEDLRPTLGRVKDAVFSMLAPLAGEAGFLDLCAGSGIMGFEAASIGFDPVWIVEQDRRAFADLEANKRLLEAAVVLVHDSAFRLERHLPPAGRWICYADPPFADKRFQARLLSQLGEAAYIAPGSLYVAETRGRPLEPQPPWRLLREKKYGRIFITLLEKEATVSDEQEDS